MGAYVCCSVFRTTGCGYRWLVLGSGAYMIPVRYWLAIAAVAGLFIGGNMMLSKAYDHGVADQKQTQAQVDQFFADLRNAEKEKIEDEARKQVAAAEHAHANAVAANAGLQQQLYHIKQLAQNATGTFTPGVSARNAVVLLADLLRQCGEKYTELAGFADVAHTAGKTCQQQYNSLRKTK